MTSVTSRPLSGNGPLQYCYTALLECWYVASDTADVDGKKKLSKNLTSVLYLCRIIIIVIGITNIIISRKEQKQGPKSCSCFVPD
jgi:hypothetical protein